MTSRPVNAGERPRSRREAWAAGLGTVWQRLTVTQLEPLEQQLRQPDVQHKILTRAAELVAQGWTRGTAARDAEGRKVPSTASEATAWCVVGAIDRALYELVGVDVYQVLGFDVATYDTAPCPLPAVRALRREPERMLGRRDLARWNDTACPDGATAEFVLRTAARMVAGRGEATGPTPPVRGPG